jgi:hypothetical protein
LVSASQLYLWFLVVITGLTGVVRLAVPRQVAVIESERLANPVVRRRRWWIGWGGVLLSPAILLYAFWGPLHPWMWMAALVGFLSSAEQLFASRFHWERAMLWHARIFGVLSAVTAIAIWAFFIHRH